jgi:hypothetical protein
MMSAPQWLIDRMEALKKLPPPTIEEAVAQWEASARWQARSAQEIRMEEKRAERAKLLEAGLIEKI